MGQRFYCSVCQECLPFENIRSFRCGHCFCASCIAQHKDTGGRSCPQCRVIIRNENAHPLYVTFRDPNMDPPDDPPSSDGLSEVVVRQAKYVTKRLGRMNEGSSLKTVQKAEENLVKIAHALEASGLVDELLDAISGFKERIIPVFATLEERQRQIAELESQRAEMHHDREQILRSQRLKIEKLEGSQRTTRTERIRAEHVADQAVASAEEATREALVLREENQKLRDERVAVLKNLENEKEKDEELRKYKGFCDDYKKKETLIKAKMKGLRQKNNDLKQDLDKLRGRNYMDDSLRIVDRSHLIDEDFDEPEMETEQPDFDFAVDVSHISPSRHRPPVPKHSTRPSLNRNPLADCPPAQIKQDDIDFRPLPTFKSDWALPPPKKRKTGPEDAQSSSNVKHRGLPFPLKLDAKGHTVGTVQLGSRSRMGK